MKLFRYTFPTTIRSTQVSSVCNCIAWRWSKGSGVFARIYHSRDPALEIITIKQRSACSTREWKIINVFFYHRGHADRSLSTDKESFEGGKKKKKGRWKALIHDRTARTRLVVSYNTIYKSYGDTYTRIYWPCYFSIGLETSWTDLTYRYESRIRSSRDYFSNLYTMFLR